jgi:hypothetical protein
MEHLLKILIINKLAHQIKIRKHFPAADCSVKASKSVNFNQLKNWNMLIVNKLQK